MAEIKQRRLPLTGDAVLDTVLDPIRPYFQRLDVIEITAVRPGEIWLERADGKWVREAAPRLDLATWQQMALAIATGDGNRYDPDTAPMVSSRLPGGHRIQMLVSEQWCAGSVDVSIRVRREGHYSPEDFGLAGPLKDEVAAVVRGGGNTIIAGNTGSGKTSLTNTVIREWVPATDRLLVAEDTDELVIPHPQAQKYRLKRNEDGAAVTYGGVFDHCMRARPDRLIFGEISIPNAYPFLLFLDSGHSGGVTTLHSRSAVDAIESAFWFRISMAGKTMDREVVARFLREKIQLVIYVERAGRRRSVSQVWFVDREDAPRYIKGETCLADAS